MMKGGVSLKSIIVIVILLLVGTLGVLGMDTLKTYMSGAAADTEPKNVVAKAGTDGKRATITWSSDKPTVGVVEYGTTPASLLLRALEAEATAEHSVALQPLKVNTNYYFRIRIGEEVYDNNGIPYSFKTKVAEGGDTGVSSVTPRPSQIVQPTVTGVEAKCKPGVDYNKDGVTNTVDMILCAKGQVTVAPESSKAATPTVKAAGGCQSNVDYDGNGVINSLDRIKCLQKGGQ